MTSLNGADMQIAEMQDRLAAKDAEISALKASRVLLRAALEATHAYAGAVTLGHIDHLEKFDAMRNALADLDDPDPAPTTTENDK